MFVCFWDIISWSNSTRAELHIRPLFHFKITQYPFFLAPNQAARAAELPNPLAKYGAALTGSAQELLNQKADEAQRLAAMQAATAAHNDNAARGGAGGPSQGSKPATLGRRVSSGFKGKKKSVAEVISAVASGGGDMMSDVVDLSSEAVFQVWVGVSGGRSTIAEENRRNED